jgi:hypothetical protein
MISYFGRRKCPARKLVWLVALLCSAAPLGNFKKTLKKNKEQQEKTKHFLRHNFVAKKIPFGSVCTSTHRCNKRSPKSSFFCLKENSSEIVSKWNFDSLSYYSVFNVR